MVMSNTTMVSLHHIAVTTSHAYQTNMYLHAMRSYVMATSCYSFHEQHDITATAHTYDDTIHNKYGLTWSDQYLLITSTARYTDDIYGKYGLTIYRPLNHLINDRIPIYPPVTPIKIQL